MVRCASIESRVVLEVSLARARKLIGPKGYVPSIDVHTI